MPNGSSTLDFHSSTAHFRVFFGLGLHLFRLSDPQNVVAPYQNLAQCARADAANKLLRVRELDVHVEVHRDESAFVFSLAPLEAHDDFVVDSVCC
jgi:hypothetical protein